MDGFHTACTFMAVLGKCFGDAGLSDVVVESGIVGPSSISGALEGRHYNRGLRMHMVMQEALLQMQWAQFALWVVEQPEFKEEDQIVTALRELRECFTEQRISELLALPEFRQLSELYLDFCRTDRGPMAAYRYGRSPQNVCQGYT